MQDRKIDDLEWSRGGNYTGPQKRDQTSRLENAGLENVDRKMSLRENAGAESERADCTGWNIKDQASSD